MKQTGHAKRWVGAGVLVAAAVCTTVAVGTDYPATASASTSTEDQAAAFTSCMRSHGVSDFPGITISENGQVHLNGGGVDPLSTAYSAAVKSCASLLPTDPQPPAPAPPTLGFACTGSCPTPPSAPALPSRP